MMTEELRDVTAKLGMDYKQWKEGEKAKNKAREEFFKLATQAIPALEERVVTITADSEEAAREEIERIYPRHRLDDIRPLSPGASDWEAIIIENPALRKFTYVNPSDGMVYERQVSDGSPGLDDERLKAENPDLYARVTTVPNEDWIKDVMYHCGVVTINVDEEFNKYLRTLDGAPERTLRDLDSLEDKDLAELADYIYEGKPTVKLAAPRPAKEEELAE